MIQRILLFCFLLIGFTNCNNPVEKNCKEPEGILEEPNPSNQGIGIEGEVEFEAKVEWSAKDNWLDTKIWITNTGADTARIELGQCSFDVIAYNRKGDVVWYNRMPESYVCLHELLIYTITPGETMELTQQSYITGDIWNWCIPDGNLEFVVKTKTEEGEIISFRADAEKL